MRAIGLTGKTYHVAFKNSRLSPVGVEFPPLFLRDVNISYSFKRFLFLEEQKI